MVETQYTSTGTYQTMPTYGQGGINGQSNMSPLVRFLLGLFTGAAVAAPVTALITNSVNKKREEKAVQKAYSQGEDAGIAAYNVMIKGEIAKGTVIVKDEAAKEFLDKVNSSDSADTNDNGTVIEKTNEGGEYIEPVIRVESVYSPGTYKTYVRDNSDENSGVTGGGIKTNQYFQGVIEDPDARESFEKRMAEMEYPAEEDINNYDLRIDDEEATQEASEFSDSHVEYLEMIRTYKNVNGNIPPMTISREQFYNEHRLEKSYVNWYDEDDIFEENDRKIEDPYYTFGFVSGKDMFSPDRVILRDDPEICHVRNLKLSTDFEITRMHGSYTKLIQDGEVYYHGEAITDI